MRLTLILVATAMVVFAADQDATKNTEKKTATTDKKKAVGKAKDADKAKAADAWVEELSKGGLPEGAPTWNDVFAALERRYGSGKLPCSAFDAAREKYFKDFVAQWVMQQGYGLDSTRQQFMKRTDLPTIWTITGRKRQGCVAD